MINRVPIKEDHDRLAKPPALRKDLKGVAKLLWMNGDIQLSREDTPALSQAPLSHSPKHPSPKVVHRQTDDELKDTFGADIWAILSPPATGSCSSTPPPDAPESSNPGSSRLRLTSVPASASSLVTLGMLHAEYKLTAATPKPFLDHRVHQLDPAKKHGRSPCFYEGPQVLPSATEKDWAAFRKIYEYA
ncbi:uncharacterized protein EHS24_006146 [Apiotrichum porosum]|uniref:Uncharacterized protein n=1 Tax=Apiotrichum porosum TaxID=105984 RepID=A0A427Y0N6_9TREE|nr:uncharacterized protein EHS24_006146 [Apiotrichum porosum]RSH84622.1 hypothetical protein EHS24_006146 [Apiotrichum porosum]